MLSKSKRMIRCRGGTAVFALSAIAAVLSSGNASATTFNLAAAGNTSASVPSFYSPGGNAIFADHFTQPAGTGVFEPFLTLDANGQTSTANKTSEQAFNTDGFTALYLDQLRPQWNDRLRVSDLATINVGGVDYFAFLLDANEPGGNKRFLSIDNVRIYTSADANAFSFAGGKTVTQIISDLAKPDNGGGNSSLGTLRYALNKLNADGTTGVPNNYVMLDAGQENVEAGPNASNGGSGKSDMILYVPKSNFAGAENEYLWFYNFNGFNAAAEGTTDQGTTSSGFEEWRAVLGPQTVPDGGATAALLGVGVIALAFARRKE